jgi:hypothetical protein
VAHHVGPPLCCLTTRPGQGSVTKPAVSCAEAASGDRLALKSLEKLLATQIGGNPAHLMLGPLVGVYKLRQLDAHLPGHEIDEALELAGVDARQPPVMQGHQMIRSCVDTLLCIGRVMENWQGSAAG